MADKRNRREYNKLWHERSKPSRKLYFKNYNALLKKTIYDHYGRICVCCGETTSAFLTIDHINNDGFKDKNRGGSRRAGNNLYRKIIDSGFPNDLQILCMNCNWGKKVNQGICPHQLIGNNQENER